MKTLKEKGFNILKLNPILFLNSINSNKNSIHSDFYMCKALFAVAAKAASLKASV
jgi:hypothetical protein